MVLPKTTAEQRAPFYDDVDSLISVGFLSHLVEVNGVSLQVRSLSPGDLFLLRNRVGRGGDPQWQAWTIASSIWMIDGYLLLGDPQAAAFIYHKISKLPTAVRDTLFSIVMGLHHRQSRALSAVEAYCFEAVSRFKWRAYRNGPVNSHAGVPGSDSLGLNHVQQMWAAFNEVEDRRNEEESLWEGFKLVASAQAPKGVKKIDEADRRRRSSEEARRQDILDKFYYSQVGILDPRGKAHEGQHQFVSRAKTVEELEEEMYNWVTGKEDWHDKVVREYKEALIARYEQEKAEAAARAEALRKAHEEESGEPAPLIGYSPEQLAEILRERDGGLQGVARVFDDDRRDSVYRKYLVRAPDAGRLRPTADGKLVVEGEMPQEELKVPEMEY